MLNAHHLYKSIAAAMSLYSEHDRVTGLDFASGSVGFFFPQ